MTKHVFPTGKSSDTQGKMYASLQCLLPLSCKPLPALRNFWVLADPALTPTSRPAFMRSGDMDLIQQVLDAHRAKDESKLSCCLHALDMRPVAVEFDEPGQPEEEADGVADRRLFRLPGASTASLRTLSFEAGGFGGSVWDCGVAMAIILSLDWQLVRGRRVLELGSGSGLGGIASALAGAQSVVLSDFGNSAGASGGPTADLGGRHKSANLQRNLRANAEASRGLCTPERPAGELSTAVLDWEDTMQTGYDADKAGLGRFTTVIGADCIYYESQCEPLAAAIRAHTAADGECHLMSRPRESGKLADGSWEGLTTLLEMLAEAGTVTSREVTLLNNDGSTDLILSTWRPH